MLCAGPSHTAPGLNAAQPDPVAASGRPRAPSPEGERLMFCMQVVSGCSLHTAVAHVHVLIATSDVTSQSSNTFQVSSAYSNTCLTLTFQKIAGIVAECMQANWLFKHIRTAVNQFACMQSGMLLDHTDVRHHEQVQRV